MGFAGVDEDVLLKFLKMARANGYGGEQPAVVPPTRAGWKHYHFEQRRFTYDDEYCGSRYFAGSEVVSTDGKPLWCMNYYGGTFEIPLETVYGFLRKALAAGCHEKSGALLRGPKLFTSGKWKYTFTGVGGLARFSGNEIVYRDNYQIYSGIVHGGRIVEK
jgi:hypothetical protein